MKKIGGVLLVLLSLVAFTYGSAEAKSIEKICVVNMQKILNDYKEAENVNAALQSDKDELQKKLDEEQDALKKKKDKLEEKASKANEADKKKMGDELNKELTKLQTNFQKYSEDLRNKQAEAFKELEAKILAAITTVSTEEGADLVLEKGVVFIGGNDITDQVLDKLNAGASKSTKKAKNK